MYLPENILTALDILSSGGFEGYAVGGCVRDAMMGIMPHDYDLTTSASPEDMLRLFADYRIIETGLKHGTVTVVINDENIEITTFRVDGEYLDNRHPETVKFTSSLEEDLSRRDFTVNAMAYNPKIGLVDLFGGMRDLESGVIRCVGEPDLRFNEDGLRILRALRFSSQLGFEIEKDTAESIRKNKGLLKNMSRERIFSELTKLLCGKTPELAVTAFCEVFAEFTECTGDFSSLSSGRADKFLRYAAFYKASLNPAANLKALRADNETIRVVTSLVKRYKEDYGDVLSVKYLLRDEGVDFANLLCEFLKSQGRDSDFFKNTISQVKDSCFSLGQLNLKGSDLMAIGMPGGKNIGIVLESALDAVISGAVPNEKDKLLTFAKSVLDNLSSP